LPRSCSSTSWQNHRETRNTSFMRFYRRQRPSWGLWDQQERTPKRSNTLDWVIVADLQQLYTKTLAEQWG
jgi:hypothetical protein